MLLLQDELYVVVPPACLSVMSSTHSVANKAINANLQDSRSKPLHVHTTLNSGPWFATVKSLLQLCKGSGAPQYYWLPWHEGAAWMHRCP